MLELFFTKENLLACAENELLFTLHTGQEPIAVFHETPFLAAAQSAPRGVSDLA
jgi:hypothetical protein